MTKKGQRGDDEWGREADDEHYLARKKGRKNHACWCRQSDSEPSSNTEFRHELKLQSEQEINIQYSRQISNSNSVGGRREPEWPLLVQYSPSQTPVRVKVKTLFLHSRPQKRRSECTDEVLPNRKKKEFSRSCPDSNRGHGKISVYESESRVLTATLHNPRRCFPSVAKPHTFSPFSGHTSKYTTEQKQTLTIFGVVQG